MDFTSILEDRKVTLQTGTHTRTGGINTNSWLKEKRNHKRENHIESAALRKAMMVEGPSSNFFLVSTIYQI